MMSKELEKIRNKIDTLDNKIHDVLMERASLIDDIVQEKKMHNLPFVNPAREAKMIRRILDRHEGPLPSAAVVRIWRELVGAVSLLQIGLKVSVCVEDDSFITWDLAKSYFGSVVNMQRHSSSLVALSSVREDESSFAVLPWPKEDDEHPWWVNIFGQDNDMRILCALPYGLMEGYPEDINNKALVVSKVEFMESGDDHSFIVLDLLKTISRARIVDIMQSCSFEPVSITSKKTTEADERTLHLVEVGGFVGDQDERLSTLQDAFDDDFASCISVGGFPVPPVYKKADAPRVNEVTLTAPPSEDAA